MTLYNKRQTTGVNEANYSTSEISGQAESTLLDRWNEKRGTQSRRIRERLLNRNCTRKAVNNVPSLVNPWQEENFTPGTHPVILTSSWICINNTSTRQWSFCHLTLNKRDLVSNNEGAEILVSVGRISTTGSPIYRVVGVCTTQTPVRHAECYSKVVILPSLSPM